MLTQEEIKMLRDILRRVQTGELDLLKKQNKTLLDLDDAIYDQLNEK
jgi:hypothetical protein